MMAKKGGRKRTGKPARPIPSTDKIDGPASSASSQRASVDQQAWQATSEQATVPKRSGAMDDESADDETLEIEEAIEFDPAPLDRRSLPKTALQMPEPANELESVDSLQDDIKWMRERETAARAAGTRGKDEGKKAAQRVVSNLLTVNVFVVVFFFGWLGVSLVGRQANVDLGLDLWLSLWTPVIQPAIGIMMLGAVVSGTLAYVAENK